MEITVVSKIRHFEIEESIITKFFKFTLLKNRNFFIEKIINDEFVWRIGINETDEFLHMPYLYFIGDSDDIESVGQLDDFVRIMINLSQSFINIIFNLWFVKDNSAFISKTVMQSGNNVNSRTQNLFFSNSSGEYKTTNWSESELNEARFYSFKTLELAGRDDIETINRPEMIEDTATSTFNYIPFDYKPIVRALHYLTIARGTSFMPYKISFYMAILEALFHSGKTDVLKNIVNRTLKFLNQDENAARTTEKLIKKCYELRSRFLHGDKVPNTRIKMIELSQAIDELLRTIFRKFYQEELKSVINKEQDEYDLWLESLYKAPDTEAR